MIEAAAAYQRARQVEQASEEVGSPLVADAKATAAEQPGERALHHPAMPPQLLRGLDAAASNPRRDAAGAECPPEGRGVVGLVSVEFGRALARSPWPPAWANDRGNVVDQREQLRRIVGVGSGEANRQR